MVPFSADILVITLVIVFLAALNHGAIGLGFPLFATPLLSLMFDVRSAVLLTLFPTIAVNVTSIMRGREWRGSIGRYWPMAVYAAFASYGSSHLLLNLDPNPFKLLLAGVILLYLYQQRKQESALPWIAQNPRGSMLLFGLIAGFLAGTVNVMVPILIIFALEVGLTSKAMIQVFNLCFMAGKAAQVVAFAQAGLLTADTLTGLAPLIVAALAGLMIGFKIRDRIPEQTFRRILKVILFVFALLLVGQFLYGLL